MKYSTFSDVLKDFCSRTGVTPTEIARKLSMDPNTMLRYYRGERSPGWDRMVDILDAIGYDISFTRKGVPKPKIFGDYRKCQDLEDKLMREDDYIIGNRSSGGNRRGDKGPLE